MGEVKMNKFVELAHKLYNEKRKLENTYTGNKLVGIIEGKA